MVIAARILADTERLQVALGVANIYSRDPTTMLGAQYGLIEQWDGRFPLGMGVSHSPVAHGVYGWGFCRWRIGRAADTMLAWGDETAIRKLIQQYWDAGANQVALQVMPKGEGL
jgi:alkanesulfonate monooxygenase SsuD/methylene tetrahydromethanopterin reductase-like flavin-dependent oxidoreductase (luciferase family)